MKKRLRDAGFLAFAFSIRFQIVFNRCRHSGYRSGGLEGGDAARQGVGRTQASLPQGRRSPVIMVDGDTSTPDYGRKKPPNKFHFTDRGLQALKPAGNAVTCWDEHTANLD
jgi:hypothetical protein